MGPWNFGIEGDLDGTIAFDGIFDKDIFNFLEIDIFHGRLEKVLQGIIERTFTAAVLAVYEQILATYRYFIRVRLFYGNVKIY